MSARGKPRTRLHVPEALASGAVVGLTAGQSHHLRTVLRAGRGEPVNLFNARDGEFAGRIDALGKGWCSVLLAAQVRAPKTELLPSLLFAPLKRQRIDMLVEKATELGVGRLVPVITRHSVTDRVTLDRLRLIATEAAEQCERLSVPEIAEPLALAALFEGWDPARAVLLGAESGASRPLAHQLADLPQTGPAPALLIGPEGGFAAEEFALLRDLPFMHPINLGPRVLRAETAALAGLAVLQAVRGDWTDASARPNFAPSC